MIGLILSITTLSSTHAFCLSSTHNNKGAAAAVRPSSRLYENAFSDPPIGSDDGDCGDECDIDWDAMPSWDEDEDEEDDDEVEAVFYDDDDEEAFLDLLPPSPVKGPSVEQRRLHMEMQWQLEEATQECQVEKPETCGSQECADCHGRGWNNCRFCHGTGILKLDKTASWANNEQQEPTTMAGALASVSSTRTAAHKRFMLPSSFSVCKICAQGVESCRTCQGSGWVASWTQIPNQRNDNGDDPLLP